MARRIDIKDIVSFEELLAAEDLRDFYDTAEGEIKKAESLNKGVYFLLEDSSVLLLNGKKYTNPQ